MGRSPPSPGTRDLQKALQYHGRRNNPCELDRSYCSRKQAKALFDSWAFLPIPHDEVFHRFFMKTIKNGDAGLGSALAC